jgi:hypothetical protein
MEGSYFKKLGVSVETYFFDSSGDGLPEDVGLEDLSSLKV